MEAVMWNRFLSSDAGRRFMAQEAEARYEKRKILAEELATVHKTMTDRILALAAEVDTAQEAFKAAQAALLEAQTRVMVARGAKMGASASRDAQESRIGKALRELAPADVAEFVTWCRRTGESERNTFNIPAGHLQGIGGGIMSPQAIQASNQAAAAAVAVQGAFEKRQKALREAAAAAEALYLEPLTDAAIIERLAKMKGELEKQHRQAGL